MHFGHRVHFKSSAVKSRRRNIKCKLTNTEYFSSDYSVFVNIHLSSKSGLRLPKKKKHIKNSLPL